MTTDVRVVYHADRAGAVRLAYTRLDESLAREPTWALREGDGHLLVRYED